ncbi:uncharacterized protein LOC113348599 [Papaver somniferum]|uniref:uncharacterized protein LOC113348599 n=1 Tax=Papaver somniferum TaxID=3469 RepID=UPI000E6FEC8B|nr:uncharacterized protein LOC113348599 [Papaver somniferum]
MFTNCRIFQPPTSCRNQLFVLNKFGSCQYFLLCYKYWWGLGYHGTEGSTCARNFIRMLRIGIRNQLVVNCISKSNCVLMGRLHQSTVTNGSALTSFLMKFSVFIFLILPTCVMKIYNAVFEQLMVNLGPSTKFFTSGQFLAEELCAKLVGSSVWRLNDGADDTLLFAHAFSHATKVFIGVLLKIFSPVVIQEYGTFVLVGIFIPVSFYRLLCLACPVHDVQIRCRDPATATGNTYEIIQADIKAHSLVISVAYTWLMKVIEQWEHEEWGSFKLTQLVDEAVRAVQVKRAALLIEDCGARVVGHTWYLTHSATLVFSLLSTATLINGDCGKYSVSRLHKYLACNKFSTSAELISTTASSSIRIGSYIRETVTDVCHFVHLPAQIQDPLVINSTSLRTRMFSMRVECCIPVYERGCPYHVTVSL